MPKMSGTSQAQMAAYTNEDRDKVVEIWKKSGLAQTAFCKGLNVHPSTLSKWCSDVRRRKGAARTFTAGGPEGRFDGEWAPHGLPGEMQGD